MPPSSTGQGDAGGAGPAAARTSRGRAGHRAGLEAETLVARRYAEAGHDVAARRWRGAGGEIDLVARDGAGFVFVEVKQARDFAAAARRISARQVGRIQAAALEFLAATGADMLTGMRFDLAVVDRSGRVEVLENAFAA